MIEVHLLRYALAAADTGSFSKAADRFGVKQSTLSKQVHYLEDRIGVALFRRSTRGVIPTSPGEGFLRKARNIVEDIDALDQECAAIARGTAGLLRFGFHGSLGSGDLSAVIRDFRALCPDVELAARERSRTRLLRGLERDQLDFAVMCGRAERPGITSLSFWSEQVMIGLAHGDILCAREPLHWTDLRGMTFVITKVDPSSLAADARLQKGMLITKIDEKPVTTAAKAQEMLQKASLEKGVLVQWQDKDGAKVRTVIQGEAANK